MKRIFAYGLYASSLLLSFSSASQVITTVAGNGIAASAGDGGAATAASIIYPQDITFDSSGNFYFPEPPSGRIRKVTTAGTIITVGGTSSGSSSGDGGPATAATLSWPEGITADKNGNLFISEGTSGNRIRKINAAGSISTYAGCGSAGWLGDGGPASSASIYGSYGLAIDTARNLYVADAYNNVIRKIDTAGIITTIAGNGTAGFSGDGGAATAAELNWPAAVMSDDDGNIIFTDNNNNRVRKISATGIITTLAGTGVAGFSGDGGPATAAQMADPTSLARDHVGNIYIADYANNRIRKISGAGIITSIAGIGTVGFSGDGGPATAAELHGPCGIKIDQFGFMYITDQGNNRIRKFYVGGLPTVLLNESNTALAAYPNPIKGTFMIKIPSSLMQNKTLIEVTDALGYVIYSREIPAKNASASEQVVLSNAPPGLYMLRVISSGSLFSQRIIVTP